MRKEKEIIFISGQIILIFACAAILYFFVGAYEFPITGVLRD